MDKDDLDQPPVPRSSPKSVTSTDGVPFALRLFRVAAPIVAAVHLDIRGATFCSQDF